MKKSNFAAILGFLSFSAAASDPSIVKTAEFTYQTNFGGREQIARSSRLAEQAPVGISVYSQNPFSRMDFNDLGKALTQAQTLAKTQIESLSVAEKDQQTIKKSLQEQLNPSVPTLNDSSHQTGSVSSTTQDLSHQSVDLPSFRSCARLALPDIKRAMSSSKVLKDERQQAAVLTRLSETRGDGKTASAIGMICGKYLGRGGASTETVFSGSIEDRFIDEVKWLASLSSRQGDEARRLLVAFIAAHHQSAPSDGRNFWLYVWSRMSFDAVFKSKAPLPTAESYLNDLISHPVQRESSPVDGVQVVQKTSYDEAKLRSSLQSGEAFSEQILEGANL